MAKKVLNLAEIKQSRDECCNLSCVALISGMAVLIFGSPSISMVVTVTAVAGGLGYVGLKQMQKLNSGEKVIRDLEKSLGWN